MLEKTITITVKERCFNFAIPNVFTPNYAGLNGVDNVFYLDVKNMTSWSLVISDRWGKEMYNSNNPQQYWNGTTKSGAVAPDGVYYYVINAACQGNTFKKAGLP
jgi:gliding motility-associated-like protein